MRGSRPGRGAAHGALLLLATLALAAGAEEGAVRRISLDQLAAVTPADAAGFQIKLTYVGTQAETVPSLLLHAAATRPSLDDFAPLRTPGVHYENDGAAVWELALEPPAIEAALARVRPLGAQAVSEPGDASVSLMVHGASGGQRVGAEALLARDAASAAVAALRVALATEPDETRKKLEAFGTALGL